MIHEKARIGQRTIIWHSELSNIGACEIGDECIIHSHAWIADGVKIGNRVRIEAFAFIPKGVTIEDDVFIGPRVTFTNDKYPPGKISDWQKTIVGCYASLGASVTVLPGIAIGSGAQIGAGSVVTKDIPNGAIAYGAPARIIEPP